MPELLTVAEVSKRQQERFVLRDISFSQQRLQKIAVAGETGSGKTTLLKIIAGLEQPTSGEIVFQKQKVRGPDETLVAGHPGIAFLPQYFELPKFLRVEQVLEYANHVTASEANKLFALCQIESLLTRKTNELSGGERQRIALCRLLIGKPTLLLLDEPFSNLDMALKEKLKHVIHEVSSKLRITCILVSHDPDDTLSWADDIIVLKAGKIIQKGNPQEIYRHPADAYVAGLFGKYLQLNSAMRKKLGNSSQVFFRPEDFKLVKGGLHSVEGKVEDVVYIGGAYMVKIAVGKTTITITSQRKLSIDQNISVALKRKK